MKFVYQRFWGFFLLSLMTSCAHDRKVNEKVEEEIQAQPIVPMGGALALESRKLISESTSLSQEQKDRLLALHARMANEVGRIREEEGRVKMVFFKTILDPKSSDFEINNLKKRILDLDRSKTKNMLGALDEARDILGRSENIERERLFRAFYFESPVGRPLGTN